MNLQEESDAGGGPLAGLRVAVTRPAAQAGPLLQRLRELGAEVLAYPTIAIAEPDDAAPLRAAIARLDSYDWIAFTSANAVAALLDGEGRPHPHPLPGGEGTTAERIPPIATPVREGEATNHARPRLAAIGGATAAALAAHDLSVDVVADVHSAAALAAAIPDVDGRRVLLPLGDLADDELARGLRARGALVDAVVAYRTVPGAGACALAEALRAGSIDAVLFTSPSTVRYLVDVIADGLFMRRRHLACVAHICIGPRTAAAARAAGLSVAATADESDADGLIAALVRHVATQGVPTR